MRESIDQWPFVFGAYGVGLLALAILIGWSYRTMRRAEKRREQMRGR